MKPTDKAIVRMVSESRGRNASNGTFELPFGPNKLFFGNTSGWSLERSSVGKQVLLSTSAREDQRVSPPATCCTGMASRMS